MQTIEWNHVGWSTLNFVFSLEEKPIGQLDFSGLWNFKAVYSDPETALYFTPKGFWNRKVIITEREKVIAEVKRGAFTPLTLYLASGEQFTLHANVWGRDVQWKNEKGDSIIQYKQATLGNMAKGSIVFKASLPLETAKILMSSGLYIRQYLRKRGAAFFSIGTILLYDSPF